MSGNGLDTSRIVAMLADVLAAQESMRGGIAELRGGIAELRTEVRDMHVELGAQGRRIDDLCEQVASLGQAVTEYHSTLLDTASMRSLRNRRRSP